MAQLGVSAQRRLVVVEEDIALEHVLRKAFTRGQGHGLLALDVVDNIAHDDTVHYWKDFTRHYLALFAGTANLEGRNLKKYPVEIPIMPEDIEHFLLAVPPMVGAEYVNGQLLVSLWQEVEHALHAEILESGGDAAAFFAARHSRVSLLGRVCFHLAENKNSNDTPFAFLATYAHQVSDAGKPKHLPLTRALEEYAGQKNMLLRLLEPIHKASQESAFIKQQTDSGDIYHPAAWTASQAYRFLQDTPIFEKSGIAVRIPNWWKAGRSPEIKVSIGEDKPSSIGFDALLDFDANLMLGDQHITESEIQELLARSENMVFFKGQWVEVDKEKLTDLLGQWKKVTRQMKEGISFAEGMRLLSGMPSAVGDNTQSVSHIRAISGAWLQETLQKIRAPEASKDLMRQLKGEVQANLRPYQEQGVAWLHLLVQLRLGAILADDMGLGKTLQVIALLALIKKQAKKPPHSLLIVPASLIGNWKAEITKFAPSLTFHIAHPSGDGVLPPEREVDLCITTYGSALRLAWLAEKKWDMLILDEAQAIKNPDAKQTRAIKNIQASHRLAMTGTPVENRLSDLWSLFDFVSPGLLGSPKEFQKFIGKKDANGHAYYTALRSLVRPYILRRLKTDKNVIADLPDKTEIKSYCALSKAQVVLYEQAVDGLVRDIKEKDGIERRGIIFSYLMRFKQICNHPAQWLKHGEFTPDESGKFLQLREICEVIAQKQEKVLVFTQFKEMTGEISRYLHSIFGSTGLILHGETPVKKRAEMVAEFQADDGPPFFVLSLKAGGVGLNLTAASHIIHFDRWWNPAVENQATDRAFRIGQKRNVLVHKFICKGTLEDQIDKMIEAKQLLSNEILEGDGGALLTELSDKDLINLVSLDIKSASAENS